MAFHAKAQAPTYKDEIFIGPSLCRVFQGNIFSSIPLESNDWTDNLPLSDLPSRTDTSGKKERLSIPVVTVSAVGIAYGLIALHNSPPRELDLSTKNEIREDHPYFVTHADDYLQWSPAAAVIGLNVAGVHGEHPFGDELCIYGTSVLIMGGTVFGLKHITHEERPDHSGFNSFPSGHTATAFAAAEWLRAEYWQRSPWIGVAGYAAATTTGILRLYNNKHWVSDIVAGAAIGFLSTRVAYAINPWIERHILHAEKRK